MGFDAPYSILVVVPYQSMSALTIMSLWSRSTWLRKRNKKEASMQVMGTNRWAMDADPQFLIQKALEFSEMVKDRGIAELHGAWLAEDQNLMWCSWDTEDLPALRVAFEEMNRLTGLTSELTPMKTFYSTVQETTALAGV